MTQEHPAVLRVQATLASLGIICEIKHLSESARSAQEAADALGIEVGQVASSIVFGLPEEPERALLVITSGRHRVDTTDYVRRHSGFAIGGVSPVGWISENGLREPLILIDEALNDYDVVWAAAGHPHAVFPSTFSELMKATQAKPMVVGD